jgi:bacteriocin-like protein
MSDEQKQLEDEELDQISGGVSSHPYPRDPIRPGVPPTHPGGPVTDPIGGKKSNPVG